MDGLVSGGNFHGEYPAKAADMLAISLQRLSLFCERRIARFVNSKKSKSSPFLTKHGGLNSGFMIAQCTSASLCS
jgi:histidine ammonia-lyase